MNSEILFSSQLEIGGVWGVLSAILNLGFSDKINPIPYPKKIL
ncbi:hypothetical protein [uncultured Gammaproteobacteria bacterium]|jgi:hypothetical protein|nr:hypothetical protein [uncultured Gammaproteobacteria bacterium]CAC9518359.1 hypothetical protein [uncultured Gammaproteobacteria bacterium]